MRVLVIGNIASVHIYNFIRYTIFEMPVDEVVLFNTNVNDVRGQTNYIEYYQKNNVRLFAVSGYFENLASGYAELKNIGHFDVCHIHFLDRPAILIGKLIARYCNVIIANYWGSDWLRADGRLKCLQEELLNISDYIVSDSRQICCQLKDYYAGKFDSLIRFARFNVPVIELICRNKVDENRKEQFRQKYTIPKSRLIITAGYNGGTAHQHLRIIDAIGKISHELKSSVFIIIPASYGLTEPYLVQLQNNLKQLDVPFLIIKDYLSDLDVACLRCITDIFINMQTTDAYSNTILEYSYLNKCVINGEWLNYTDLEKAGAFYEKIDSFESLPDVLSKILKCFEKETQKFKNNSLAVERYQYENSKLEIWSEMYFKSNPVDETQQYRKNVISEKCKDSLNDTLKSYYLKEMLCILKLEEQIGAWVVKKALKSLVIYGAGDIGCILYRQFENKGIDQLYVADRSVQNVGWFPLPVLSIQDLSVVRPDAIVITPLVETIEIKEQLSAQVQSAVYTFYEWLDEIRFGGKNG